MFESDEKLEKAIIDDKARGIPDKEIGRKYGVTHRFIEKIITRRRGINVSSINKRKGIKFLEPSEFSLQEGSVWSFKQRGNWATHSGEYRGNFSPYIPRNIILRYSNPGELVLDMFCGGGTTAIESKLLGRRCIASDINEKAIEFARENLDFNFNPLQFPELPIKKIFEPELYVKDARDLSWIKDESIDLICTHPPYANIIQYTDNKAADLSFLDIEDFLKEMQKVAAESFRVIKPGRQCALLIGDTRRKRHVVPIGFWLIDVYLKTGFELRELIIKRQHNCKTTGFWYDKSIKNNFLLLAHEYLPVFEKPYRKNKRSKVTEQKSSLNLKKVQVPKKYIAQTLETTTVWVFPDDRRDQLLSDNLIKRYASDDGYIKIVIDKQLKCGGPKELRFKKDHCKLIWIDSPALAGELSFGIGEYLEAVAKMVKQGTDLLETEGFFAIETRDVRYNGKIIPFAKLIIEMLKNEPLWLKEIIIVTSEDGKPNLKQIGDYIHNTAEKSDPEYLQINHSYLLIYEKNC
ncbi:MAG: DNA methyltransferase [Candidatus Saccharicenans sp.]|nr:DNA methyltransferase [Candidatus Saccharicenans sp.]